MLFCFKRERRHWLDTVHLCADQNHLEDPTWRSTLDNFYLERTETTWLWSERTWFHPPDRPFRPWELSQVAEILCVSISSYSPGILRGHQPLRIVLSLKWGLSPASAKVWESKERNAKARMSSLLLRTRTLWAAITSGTISVLLLSDF